jgi:threonine dehydratase
MSDTYIERILRARVYDVAMESPLEVAPRLSRRIGNSVLLKREDLQPVFSFKLRGAYNKMANLPRERLKKGVIAASAGNHAQGVALAAQKLGCRAVIVMPVTTPRIKVDAVAARGARVVLHGDSYDEAYAEAMRLKRKQGLAFVHPYDDPDVIAGQGTLGLELLEQLRELDAVLVPIGGGGLAAGVGLAIKARRPAVRVIGVQSQALPAMQRSLEAGARLTLVSAPTIADGIAVRQVGEQTLELVRKHVDDVVTVSEEELANAILLLLEIEKTVVEGAGAAPLAALVNRALGLDGACVVLVLSGGNIDVTILSRIIERGLVKDGRLVRLALVVRDRPGELARLTALIAEERANILHIEHTRAFSEAPIGETEVELTLETSGRQQIERLLARLGGVGYRAAEHRP